MAESRIISGRSGVDSLRQDRAVWRLFNNRRVLDTGGYIPKIDSFRSKIEYEKTNDTSYMAEKANEVLKHFGFGETATATKRVTPGFTDYTLFVDGDEVSGYRQYGNGERRIAMNLEDMLHDAVLYKIRKKSGDVMADSLTDAMGRIQRLRWRFYRNGEEY
jgi:hypothetical protein